MDNAEDQVEPRSTESKRLFTVRHGLTFSAQMFRRLDGDLPPLMQAK